MSNFGLDNLPETKPDFVLKKLPPITYEPIVEFTKTLNSIDNEYNNTFAIWFTIIIVICSVIVASLLIYLLMTLKCANECSQYFTQTGQWKQTPPTMEMIPMTPTTSSELQKRTQKEEFKNINSRAYENYLLRKYGKTLTSII